MTQGDTNVAPAVYRANEIIVSTNSFTDTDSPILTTFFKQMPAIRAKHPSKCSPQERSIDCVEMLAPALATRLGKFGPIFCRASAYAYKPQNEELAIIN